MSVSNPHKAYSEAAVELRTAEIYVARAETALIAARRRYNEAARAVLAGLVSSHTAFDTKAEGQK